jgi:hypothetical protein
MSDKVEVAFGWVVLRDPRMVKDRERKRILSAALGLSEDDMQDMLKRSKSQSFSEQHDFENVFAATMIDEWSFDEPVTSEGLSELPWVTRKDITEVVSPLFRGLFPEFDPDPSPDSPTEPSGE